MLLSRYLEYFSKSKSKLFVISLVNHFFDEVDDVNRKSLISKYYFKNDVHFNKQGNYKLYKNFINTFNN